MIGTELDLLVGLMLTGETDRRIVRLMATMSAAPLVGKSSETVRALGPALTEPAGGPSEAKAPHSMGRAGHAGSSTEDAPPLPPKVAVEGEVAASPGEAAGDAMAPGGGPGWDSRVNRYTADNL